MINPRLFSFSLSLNWGRFYPFGIFIDLISNKLLKWSIDEATYGYLAEKTYNMRYWLTRETIVDKKVFYFDKNYHIPDVGKFWIGDCQSLLVFQSISAIIRKRVLKTWNKGLMLDTFSKYPRFLFLATTMKISLYEIYLLVILGHKSKKKEAIAVSNCKHSIVEVHILIWRQRGIYRDHNAFCSLQIFVS